MKKLLLIASLMFCFSAIYSQNYRGYVVEGFTRLEAKRAFVLGGDAVYATTQLTGNDTILVTLDYLTNKLKFKIDSLTDYNITSLTVSGTSTKTIKIANEMGDTISASFMDMVGEIGSGDNWGSQSATTDNVTILGNGIDPLRINEDVMITRDALDTLIISIEQPYATGQIPIWDADSVFFRTDIGIGNLIPSSSKITVNNGTGAVIGAGTFIDVNEPNLTLSNMGGSTTDGQVPNTITLDNITQITNRSHTSLADKGTNTHVQIDTHISSDGDLSSSNELNTSMSWNDATNTISVTDPGGAKSTIITGFLESAALTPYKLKSDSTLSDGYVRRDRLTSSLITKENTFTKNTAFNKNFGTTSETVLEGRTFGTAANSNISAFEVPLTFGTGLSRVGNAVSSTITQYTDALSRTAISLTTFGTTGAATYSSTTGELNIPQYTGGAGASDLTFTGTTSTYTLNSSTGTDVTFTATSPISITRNINDLEFGLLSGYGDIQNPYESKTQKYVLAAPNSFNGAPVFRALLASDIPTLSYVTSVTGGAGLKQTGTTSITLDIVSRTGTTGSVGRMAIVNDSLGVELGTTGTTSFRGDYGNAAYNGRINELTNLGTSGNATFSGNTLNIPAYTLSGLGYSIPTFTIDSLNRVFKLTLGGVHTVKFLDTDTDTNTLTSLSTGSVTPTTYGINSDGSPDDIILPEATGSNAGLLGSVKWSNIGAAYNYSQIGHLSLTGGTMSNTTKVTNLNADLIDGINSNEFLYKTAYNFTNGMLIATNILEASNEMFTLHIEGNGYNSTTKFDIWAQGYNYNVGNSILRYMGNSINYNETIYYFIYNGFLHMWLPQQSGNNSQTFNCFVKSSTGSITNRITTITNVVKPTVGITREVSFTCKKIWNESNFVAGVNYQSPVSLTTIGSSGASTFTSNVLNIPNYTLSGLGYVAPDLSVYKLQSDSIEVDGYVRRDRLTSSLVTKENSFSKNTAFNKNFGTTAGTVLEGRTFGTAAASNIGDFIQNQNSTPQTGNSWINGNVRGNTLQSHVATGTAPITVASTTLVSNLNANLLGGLQSNQLKSTTAYAFTNGLLIATDIADGLSGMFTLEIDGNGYSGEKFKISTQGYLYNPSSAIIQYRGYSINYDNTIYYFIYNGYLHIWLNENGPARTFNCTVLSGSLTPTGVNRITGITNVVKPTTGVTKEVSFVCKKIWNETNSNLTSVNWSSYVNNSLQYNLNGANINTAGTLSNVAYKGPLTTDYIVKYDGSVLKNSTLNNTATSFGFNTTANTTIGLYNYNSSLTGITQTGTYSYILGNSAATGAIRAYVSQPGTVAGSFTAANVFGMVMFDAIKGAGSTITTQYGLFVGDLSQGNTNYGIHSNVLSGTNKWNLYIAGTANNYFNSNVGIGTTTPGAKLHVNNGSAIIENAGSVSLSLNDNSSTQIPTINFQQGGVTKASIKGGTGLGKRLDFTFGSGTYLSMGAGSVGGLSLGSEYINTVPPINGIIIEGKVGIGTTTPNEKLEVAGKIKTTTFQMTTSPVAGYFMQTDASGNGSWIAVAASQVYKGTWNATTNTPTLTDGIGTAGWYYRVTVAGTINLGSGNITFSVGDDVSYNGTIWQRIPANTYVLTAATTSTLGGVIVGNSLNIASSVLDLKDGDKGDITVALTGTSFTIDANSVISSKIAVDNILESHLKVVNEPVDEYALTYDAMTGDFEWQPIISTNQLITLSGGAEGSGTTAITVTIPDDTHNHTSSTISGLSVIDFINTNLSLWTNDNNWISDGNTNWDNIYGFITDGNTNWDNSYEFVTATNHTLDGHSNVSVTANTANELLQWNGTNWVNRTLSEAGISTDIHSNIAALNSVTSINGSNTGDNAPNTLYSGFVSNVNHTGDVTGSTTLTIGDNKIIESMLKAVNNPTDEYALTYEATTGDFEWQNIAPSKWVDHAYGIYNNAATSIGIGQAPANTGYRLWINGATFQEGALNMTDNPIKFATTVQVSELSSMTGYDSGYGTFYGKTDGKPYYRSGTGVEYDLTSTGSTVVEEDPIYTYSSWFLTANNSNNWNISHGWGNHAVQGYITSSYSVYGDLSGTIGSMSVTDDSHNHNSTTISTDIISSIEGVTNDGGNIDFIGLGGISVTSNDAANTVTLTGTLYSLPKAESGIRGGVQLGYMQTGTNYPVLMDLYTEQVYVPLPVASTTYKGIAQFSSANFATALGVVTVKTGGIGATELVSTTVTAGSYTSLNATIDADGRITSASNGSSGAPGGINNDIQYKGGSSFLGKSDFNFNPATNSVNVTGTVTAANFILNSDRRLKTEITDLTNLDWVDNIPFKSFKMASDATGKLRYGVIAQEVEEVNSELVNTNKDGMKSVNYIDLLIAKVTRQDELIKGLIERLEKLEND